MTDKITVIYNDTCPICSREVNGYRRSTDRNGGTVAYSGLSEGACDSFGLTEDAAARRFHVLEDGVLLSGVPAFAALWARIPGLRWLSRFVRLPGVRGLAGFVYDRLLAPPLYALHKRRQRRTESLSDHGGTS
jgi:predicted DCC family thiol-disulfide oxidoreductase YuxK